MEKKLQKIQDALSPSEKFVARLHRKLWRQHLLEGGKHFFAWQPFPARKYIAATVLLLTLGVGLSAYAYASPEVTNGSPLYGLKRGLEGLEGSFATSGQAQAEFHFKMALRRLQESKILAATGTVDIQTMSAISDESHTALSDLDSIEDVQVKTKVLAEFSGKLTSSLKEVSIKIGSDRRLINGNDNSENGYNDHAEEGIAKLEGNINSADNSSANTNRHLSRDNTGDQEKEQSRAGEASLRSNAEIKTKIEGLLREVQDKETKKDSDKEESIKSENKQEQEREVNANGNHTVSSDSTDTRREGRTTESLSSNENQDNNGTTIFNTQIDTNSEINRNVNEKSNGDSESTAGDTKEPEPSTSEPPKNSNSNSSKLDPDTDIVPVSEVNLP
jgi:hypothetical protein